MSRPAVATIDLEAIKQNYLLAKRLSNNARAVAIIKANAYGHGAVVVAHKLEESVDAFGVACIEEAVELRNAGITKPILLLEGFFTPDELPYIAKNNIWCAIHNGQQIDQIATMNLSDEITFWLKMDSGMHRLGIAPEDYSELYRKLNALPCCAEIVCMSHFSSSDEIDNPKTNTQMATFDASTHEIKAQHSIANSAAILAHANARRDWQRPGIMLYGASPFDHEQENANALQTVMRLTSKIIAIHDLNKGDPVGYGETWVCDKPTRVGTVAMGYADGYPRHAKNGTPVMIDGVKSRLIGRVSMDMITVDLSDVPDAHIGSDVEFWGENISINEIARCADTIPYTLYTGITSRVHKHYINEK